MRRRQKTLATIGSWSLAELLSFLMVIYTYFGVSTNLIYSLWQNYRILQFMDQNKNKIYDQPTEHSPIPKKLKEIIILLTDCMQNTEIDHLGSTCKLFSCLVFPHLLKIYLGSVVAVVTVVVVTIVKRIYCTFLNVCI